MGKDDEAVMADGAARKVHTIVETQLSRLGDSLEKFLDADVIGMIGPIYPGLDSSVREAIEARPNRRDTICVVLTTPGGIIETVERIVHTLRSHYDELIVIVPDAAMSAGTVLSLSADRILMDNFSCLGPIDPQIERNGKLVPALSYLIQFNRLKERAAAGLLTTAEMVMLQQLDLAELHKFEEAKELSVSLLKEWLAKYKFKDWALTETSQTPVTPEMKVQRAEEIAVELMNPERWHSHGRPIHMDALKRDLKLRIEDFGANSELADAIKVYHGLLMDYMQQMNVPMVVHTADTCIK